MGNRYRPSISEGNKEMIDEFLDKYPELPFTDAKDLMLFATKKYMNEVETEEETIKRQKQELQDLAERLKGSGD